MLLKRFYDANLAQASYLIACQATGDAIVVDPNRDIAQYMRAAEEEGVRLRYVTETHIHADFVSGARELAATTGATLLLSDEGGDDWRYAFAESDHATLLHDGDVIRVGNIRLDVVHTPGHTPEHISFIVTDGAATDRPMGALTGDFIFVGDVGRPDLLERAANIAGTMEAGARSLFASIQRFGTYPDYLQLWPGHGAGSACGKSLGAVPSTTLGYEKIANWALAPQSESDFVQHVLEGQPEPPKYFAEMKRINRAGPPPLGALPRPQRFDATMLSDHLATGALVVDTRPAKGFASRFVPGTISIPFDRGFTNWSGSLIPFDRDFSLIIDDTDPRTVVAVQRSLAMIGLDRLAGYFGTDAIDAYVAKGGSADSVRQLTVTELASDDGGRGVQVVDVRGAAEWGAGHMPGVLNIPLGSLPDRLNELSRDRPVVVHCQGGGRSSIAAGILKANGFDDVANLVGGFGEWARAGLEVERPK
ncbi:MAG: MBL fold metallo-hydrolase, partial [Gemmatimonadota bacterium]|nr:MBL fold metallo-hydrolase [Gemmatimonadota bacterium]